jgi:predicted RNase H-like HicB family nuclease
MQEFSFDTHIFKEGDTFVAYVPALDISSCGATDDEARRNIRDAVRGFLAACADMGTIDEILQEATPYRAAAGLGTGSTRTN